MRQPASVLSREASRAPAPAPHRRARGWRRPTLVAWSVVLGTLLLRLPHVGAPAGPDEAGFLQVAGQWTPGGGSLYGHYWVDRPPLLLTVYRLAALSGGTTALRLLGVVAVAITVWCSARAARLLAGPRASRWTAVSVAALLVAPQLGAQEVNGELLAAPFVAVGILALVAARASAPRRWWLAVLGGGCAAAAALVKQNVLDVFVFAVALVATSWWTERRRGAALGRLVAATVGGAALAVVGVAAWTVAHGTSLTAVVDAMYAFRIQAAHTLASAGGLAHAQARAVSLALGWLASGLAAMALALGLTVRRWCRSPVMVALAVTAAFDLVSVALGGGYWHHYLVQAVVPLGIATGVLTARAQVTARAAALATASLCLGAAVVGVFSVPTASAAQVAGAAVAEAHHAGDTLTTLYGDPRINLAAGLRSPYRYLWSLPVKTRDRHLAELDRILRGPDAPTWLVVKRRIRSWGLDTRLTAHLIAARYRRVAEYDGQSVYLRKGAVRPAPVFAAPGSSRTR